MRSELRHEKVECFHLKRGNIGRILDFSRIVVTRSGGTHAPIPRIADPLKLRSAALTCIETPAI